MTSDTSRARRRAERERNQMPLPITIEELTPRWLTDALRHRHPEIEVTHAEQSGVMWGSATKVFLRVQYADAPGSDGPPEALCVKGGFDERVREALKGVNDAGNQMEAQFFADLAARVDAPLPSCWYAGSEPGQGVMIFEDLRDAGVTFGDPTQPWGTDEVASALELLARLHSSSWAVGFDDVPWLEVGSSTVRQAAAVLFSEQHWESHFARPEAPKLPGSVADRERDLQGYAALWAHDDAAAHCLCHGDAHLGNTYIDRDGHPVFLDWATSCLAPWSYDVAYFMTGALTVADRRAHERELLDHYLDTLTGHDGPAVDAHDAWLDYRRHQMHGLIWATLPSVLQSAENMSAMAERYVAAIDDHETLRLLGV